MKELTYGEIEILKEAIHVYGSEHQLDMVIEECSELIKAIIKNRRYTSIRTLHDIQEEAADVFVVLAQICIMFGGDPINKIISEKILELKRRLDAKL